ncbi:MAG: response regulator transcription factor [Pseudomonadota bacterium]
MVANNKYKVLLVDDHALVRSAMGQLINSAPDLEVIAEADNVPEAQALTRDLNPDLSLVDISMPGLSGLEYVRRCKKSAQSPKIIVISMHKSLDYVEQAMNAGADGFLTKDVAVEELRQAIDAVLADKTYLSEELETGVKNKHDAGPLATLTNRQTEVLRLLAQSKTTKQIADDLHISAKTVETHRAELMRRLDIHDVPGLVRFAIANGLVSITDD